MTHLERKEKQKVSSPGFLLWQTTTLWQRQIKKALEPYNLSHSHFVILSIVQHFEEQKKQPNQVHIISLSKLDKMTVSKALKLLSSHGFVLREENSFDTRAKRVSLTEKGRLVLSELIPIITSVDSLFFSHSSVEKQQLFLEHLKCLSTFTPAALFDAPS